jgi:aminopeptidase YwaD
MNKLSGILGVILLCCTFCAYGQVEPNYDTILPKDYFLDTVKHVQFTALDSNGGVPVPKRDPLVQAEMDKRWMKTQIQKLSARNMYGRGYVKGGKDSAAIFIAKKFKELKLQSVSKDGRYGQGFSFPVNTFPGKMSLIIDEDTLIPGLDFLIDPASPSLKKEAMPMAKIDLDEVNNYLDWARVLRTIDTTHVYYVKNVDSFCVRVLHIRPSAFASKLPKGCYIIPEEGKLTWSVSRETIPATVLYVRESALQKKMGQATVDVVAVFEPKMRNENVVAYMPGTIKDTFIAFTAHYDHLGLMGDTAAFFPGASDNASGVAVMLFLANWFSKHPSKYSILFIAFAGEEASLMGSEFFVKSPLVPLKNIKFLTNIDIMGDATDGITVVNATEFPVEFQLLKQVNEKGSYVPEIKKRGKAANSDHYYFTNQGVHCFFTYSNGGKGYYHDVFDKPREVTLNHVDGVARMLIDFVKEISNLHL